MKIKEAKATVANIGLRIVYIRSLRAYTLSKVNADGTPAHAYSKSDYTGEQIEAMDVAALNSWIAEVIPPAVEEATHEVVADVFGDIVKTGTYAECIMFMGVSDLEGLTLRTLGETARVKAAGVESRKVYAERMTENTPDELAQALECAKRAVTLAEGLSGVVQVANAPSHDDLMTFVRRVGYSAVSLFDLVHDARALCGQADAPQDDDMACTLAGLARLLHAASDKAWDTSVPADVLHRMRFLADELEQVSCREACGTGEGFEPEYLYQMSAYRTDLKWVNCVDKATYDYGVEIGLPVRRFVLVKE